MLRNAFDFLEGTAAGVELKSFKPIVWAYFCLISTEGILATVISRSSGPSGLATFTSFPLLVYSLIVNFLVDPTNSDDMISTETRS